MEIRLAKTAGFCFGVERAVNTVYEEIEKGHEPISTYGPIIHNENVVADLERKGVTVLPEDLDHYENLSGTVVIRSHGVSRAVCDSLKQPGVHLVDATCPFVKKIHRIVEKQGNDGNVVLIAGDANHPEVQGIIGWCTGPVHIIKNYEDFEKIPDLCDKMITLVAQTTFNYKKFRDLVAKIQEKGYDINVLNTICNATQERQEEAKQIAASVDGMIVIGGKNSSNTQKLFEICKKECNNTYHVQSADDLKDEWLHGLQVVGITAGASTPKNIIEEVQTHVRSKF